MIDLGQVPARSVDRRRATVAAVVVVLGALPVLKNVARPVGISFPLLANVITLSIAIIAFATALLWVQARVTRSAALLFLAAMYATTTIVMVPYLAFYHNLFPGLTLALSADPSTASWLWFEWHLLFALSPAVYVLARRFGGTFDIASFHHMQNRVLSGIAVGSAAMIAPVVWIDGLPPFVRDGRYTETANISSGLLIVVGALSLVVLIVAGRLRSILDLWLAVASLCLIADVAFSISASAPFTVGWYLSRIYILIGFGIVLTKLILQTARVYAHAALTADRLRDDSMTDALTGIANRRNLDMRLAQIVADSARAMRPVALLMMDIDNFKIYNDTSGHQAGDRALTSIASVLTSQVNRGRDLVARYGGEEFAVVLPETELAGSFAVAERLRAAVERTGLTVSIGIAITSIGIAEAPDTLIARADHSLYAAKHDGRNCVAYLPAIDETGAAA